MTLLYNCLNGSTELKKSITSVEPYFYPFDMEFCLVAVGMLLTMLFEKRNSSKVEYYYIYQSYKCSIIGSVH